MGIHATGHLANKTLRITCDNSYSLQQYMDDNGLFGLFQICHSKLCNFQNNIFPKEKAMQKCELLLRIYGMAFHSSRLHFFSIPYLYHKLHWITQCKINQQIDPYFTANKGRHYICNTFTYWHIPPSAITRTRQIWGIWKLRPAYSPETPNLGQNRWCFVPCDLEIWWMTLKNNRAPLQCYFKLCASFRSHWWFQTGVTVRKRPIWVKIDNF